jgi:hypothetical protein
VPHPSWSGLLGASQVAMPLGHVAVRDSQGRFGFVRDLSSLPASLTVMAPAGAAGWVTWRSSGDVRRSWPGLAFDDQDRLHAFLEVATHAEGPWWQLIHRWCDAGAWQEEASGTIATPSLSPASSALGPSGVPHLLMWQAFAAPGAPPPTWATRGADGWTATPLAAPWDVAEPSSNLAVDPDGEPGFLARTSGGFTLLRHGVAGWTGSPELLFGVGGWRAELWLPSPGRALVGRSWRGAGSATDFWIQEVDASGWGTEELALTRPGGSPEQFAMAVSPDGSRVAVVSNGMSPALALRDGAGWLHVPLAPSLGNVAVGFRASGKLWILTGLADSWTTGDAPESTVYVLYEEE